jgi:hypothetical protein
MEQNEEIGVVDNDDENELTEAEKAYEKQIERLDSFFGSLHPGVSVLIERLRPNWCAGLLEEVPITDEGLNLDYLIETWGGHLLLCKIRGMRGRLIGGSYKVPLYSYPPLRYGEVLRPQDRGDRFKQDEDTTAPSGQSPVVVNQSSSMDKFFAALPALAPFVVKMLENSDARRREDMAMMMQMMKAQQTNPFGDITKIGNVMTQLSDLFANNMNNGNANGGNEMDFMTHVMDVLKMTFENPQQQPQARLTQPQQTSGPPAPVTRLNPSAQSQPQNVAQTISAMEPQNAAETIIEAIGRMPSDNREAAIGHLIAEYQAMENDEDSEEEDSNLEKKTSLQG